MTLEEAIKRYTSNAFYEKSDGNLQGYLEFNQLAEWLEDYKRLLEQEPKTGHWKRIGYDIYECSICGQNVMTSDICAYRHCHGCGAKMESEVKENG